MKAEESSDEIEASHVTEDDVSTEAEVSADLEALKNVRVKRMVLPLRVGLSDVIWIKRAHPVTNPSGYVARLSTLSSILVGGNRDLFVISCVCGRQWYLASSSQPSHAPKQPRRQSNHINPAIPLGILSLAAELNFEQCTSCAWWHHVRCMKTYRNPIKNFCHLNCLPDGNE